MAVKIAGRFGRASASDMYRLLGVTGSRLPREGMAERLIDGVRVYVAPLVPGWGKRWQRGSVAKCWQGLRVMAICDCGRHIPVGRLHQHKCPTVYVYTLVVALPNAEPRRRMVIVYQQMTQFRRREMFQRAQAALECIRPDAILLSVVENSASEGIVK